MGVFEEMKYFLDLMLKVDFMLISDSRFRQQNTYLATSHELHHQEKVLLVFIDIIQLHYIGVVNLLENIDFIL